jgi:hypothetical protein
MQGSAGDLARGGDDAWMPKQGRRHEGLRRSAPLRAGQWRPDEHRAWRRGGRAAAWGAKAADRKNGYEVKRALCGMRGERIKKAGMKFLKMTVKSMNVRDYVHQLRIYSSISVPRNISQLYSLVPVPRKIKTGMYIFSSSEVQED